MVGLNRDRRQTKCGALLPVLRTARRTPGAIRAGTPMYMTSLTYNMSRKSPSAYANLRACGPVRRAYVLSRYVFWGRTDRNRSKDLADGADMH